MTGYRRRRARRHGAGLVLLVLLVLPVLAASPAAPETKPVGRIDTVVGGGDGDGGAPTGALVDFVSGLVLDGNDNLHFSDSSANRVRMVDRVFRVVRPVAGKGSVYPPGTAEAAAEERGTLLASLSGATGDGGPAANASFRFPYGLAFDPAGNLYIADNDGHRVRKVDALTRVVTTVAGNGTPGFSGDGGQATEARLDAPEGLAFRDANLYIADGPNRRVRRVNLQTGVITTVAGNGRFGSTGDGGPATAASFGYPAGLAFDAAGQLYVSDRLTGTVRKLTPDGRITTAAADLSFPGGVAVDRAGNLYVAETGAHRVVRVTTDGTVSTYFGTYPGGDAVPVCSAFPPPPTPLTAACNVGNVAVDRAGSVYFDVSTFDEVSGLYARRIRRVTPGGHVFTHAGNGSHSYCCDGMPATSAGLGAPAAPAVDAAGNLYVADYGNDRVRRVDAATGMITTVAGAGTLPAGTPCPAAVDGVAATAAILCGPADVAVDRHGNLYIAEDAGHRVRKVTNGVITTLAGTGVAGFNQATLATEAQLRSPRGLDVDVDGTTLHVADTANDLVRRVHLTATPPTIETVAGTGARPDPRCPAPAAAAVGDGGPATAARLVCPQDVAVDGGDRYVADTANQRVRRIASSGTITTVAGTGQAGYSGDGGPGTAARVFGPVGVVARDGVVHFSDLQNARVRRVDTSGIITTVAGRGFTGSEFQLVGGANTGSFSGDGGPAAAADLRQPRKLALSADGRRLYLADSGNDRIRLVQLSQP